MGLDIGTAGVISQTNVHIIKRFEEFTADGNFTVPDKVTEVDVTIVGGGGGGRNAGGGGGGGQMTIVRKLSVEPGAVIPVTVAGNAAIAADGDYSSFGMIFASGGQAGQFAAGGDGGGGNNTTAGGGEAGGAAAGVDVDIINDLLGNTATDIINLKGASGGDNNFIGGNGLYYVGGSTPGAGGAGGYGGVGGDGGANAGGVGAGGGSNGTGGAGIVIVSYYREIDNS